jgi:mannonate dehydratase
MAAALHIGLSAHNFGIQEFARYSQAAVDVFAPEYTFAEGSLRPAETPGLGVSYDADLGEKYEYEPSYLPVNRLADGTVHDW